MANKKNLLLDVGVGLLLASAVAGSYWTGEPFLASVEYKAYDFRSKFRGTLKSPDELVIVSVDDDAISQFGRWPWPRTRVAAILDRIEADKPRVIGLNILFSEAEQNQGLGEVKRLEEKYKELLAGRKVVQKGVDFTAEFSSAAAALDSDSKFLASVSAGGNVVMPLFFVANPTRSKQAAVPPEISSGAVRAVGVPEGALASESKMIPPLAAFVGAAAGFGHANLYPESDGVFRRDSPLVEYEGMLYPSFALRLAMAYHGLKPEDLKFVPYSEVTAGKIRVPVDSAGETPVTFLAPPSADVIKRVSYQTLMSGSLAPGYFQDKIVLVGLTASGVQTNFATPVAGDVSSVDIIANSLENILHERYLTRPPWTGQLELGLIGAIALFIMFALPRMRAFWGLIVSLVLAIAIMGAGMYFFVVAGQWVKVGYPLVLLLGGYLVVISKGFLVTEKGKELVEASAIETNKMLGLSFQGQGMLDLAFEKFRLCPLDDNMKDTLYNLALDFERKRQYSKAAAVFDHIAAKDAKYKDVVERGKKLKEASEGAVFGGVGAKKEGTVMITGGASKPTLGRYEIEKELGRGAMGVVYLGRDPKINRMVAIKTMMLEEGSDGGSLKEVKERFFREAESAGTLNHPNIVRIFDAGEENEVAYIAMELLDGQDLTKFTGKDALLPSEKAIDYVATVADALDYAHAQGIVHRDIKPANVMLLKDGSIRVADFGIARITASSKTATGTVMGTPSYMSPEQVAGRKVDGRSDLFSLTVALYELLAGEKPFKGGEGIGTLLFQIANDPHPDLLQARAGLAPALKNVIDRGLAKNPDERFQRGSEMAAALREILAGKTSAPAPAPAPARTAPTLEVTQPAFAPVKAEPTLPAAPVASLAPAPTPAPTAKPEERTGALLSATIKELDEFLTAQTPASAPKSSASDKTILIGPEITIPGLNDRTSPVAPAPTPVPESTMSLELPQHSGVGHGSEPPPPPPPRDPDATVRLKPNPQEPL